MGYMAIFFTFFANFGEFLFQRLSGKSKWALKWRFEKPLEDTKESPPVIFCHQTRTVENPSRSFQTVSPEGVLQSEDGPEKALRKASEQCFGPRIGGRSQ